MSLLLMEHSIVQLIFCNISRCAVLVFWAAWRLLWLISLPLQRSAAVTKL